MELTVGRMQGCYSFHPLHPSPPHHQIKDNSFTVDYSLNCLKSAQSTNGGIQKLLKPFSYSWPLLWVIKFTFDCVKMLQHIFKKTPNLLIKYCQDECIELLMQYMHSHEHFTVLGMQPSKTITVSDRALNLLFKKYLSFELLENPY